jgi:hypothetical protein
MVLIAVTITLLVGSSIVASIGWWQTRRRLRQLEGRNAAEPRTDPRIDRLEQLVDAMAMQVDRVTEAQDFLTRVVTERRSQLPARPAPGGEAVTPH